MNARGKPEDSSSARPIDLRLCGLADGTVERGRKAASHARARVHAGLIICALSAVAFGETPALAQSKTRVAVATATGPRSAAPVTLTKGVVKGLKAGGLSVVAGRRYRRRASQEGLKTSDLAAAAAVRARYLVKLRVKTARNRLLAQAVVRRTDGSGVRRFRLRYRSGEQSGAAGARLGANIAEFIAEESGSPTLATRSLTLPGAEPPESGPAPEPTSVTGSETESATGGEFAAFRIGLSVGSELANGYRVRVANQETGLGYDLGPLPRIDLSAQYIWRPLGLGVRLEYGFTPLTYSLADQPPIADQRGAGSLFSFGGQIFYAIDIARFGAEGRVTVFPMVGAGFTALRIDEAGADSIFLGYDATEVLAGARGRVLLSDVLAVELDLRAGAVVGYSEAPATTGDGGLGFVLQAGGSVRYWLTSSFGLSSEVTYQFRQTGMSGTGDRTIFPEDPALEDATVSTAHLRLTGAVIFSL